MLKRFKWWLIRKLGGYTEDGLNAVCNRLVGEARQKHAATMQNTAAQYRQDLAARTVAVTKIVESFSPRISFSPIPPDLTYAELYATMRVDRLTLVRAECMHDIHSRGILSTQLADELMRQMLTITLTSPYQERKS